MRTLTWTAADGTVTVLDGSAGVTLLDDPVGLESAPPRNTIDEYIAFDGGVLVDRRYPVRSVALALFVEHATRIETAIAALASMLQGPGQLRYADDVNTRTLRQVIYEAGINGAGVTTVTQRSLVVSMLCLDPWFYGPAQLVVLPASAPTGFDAAIGFNAFLPFDGGNAATIIVAGDAEAYPVVTVLGPVTTLTVGAGNTAWTLASPLLAGDVLVVDHRPGSRGPRKGLAATDWSLLTEASRLFTIGPGAMSVISGATGTTGATSITISYESRYLTP